MYNNIPWQSFCSLEVDILKKIYNVSDFCEIEVRFSLHFLSFSVFGEITHTHTQKQQQQQYLLLLLYRKEHKKEGRELGGRCLANTPI